MATQTVSIIYQPQRQRRPNVHCQTKRRKLKVFCVTSGVLSHIFRGVQWNESSAYTRMEAQRSAAASSHEAQAWDHEPIHTTYVSAYIRNIATKEREDRTQIISMWFYWRVQPSGKQPTFPLQSVEKPVTPLL